MSDTKFQYRFGDDGSYKSFVVEIEWMEDYPHQSPTINLNVFYNQHVPENFKTTLYNKLVNVAEHEMGNPVTYILFEHIRENLDDYLNLINVETRILDKVY